MTHFIASIFGPESSLAILAPWLPLILKGFGLNLVISFLAMAIGLVFGAFLGAAQLAKPPLIRWIAKTVTLLLRNSPWLVVMFYVMLIMPFEIHLFGTWFGLPDWIKAVVALVFPVCGYTSEIVRGGIAAVPTTQWEASDALAFSPYQTMTSIILPQAIRQMLPPTMNLYCSVIMATSLANVVGVQEVMTITQTILTTEIRPGLILPAYGLTLVLFFIYVFPISLLSRRIERAWQVGNSK